MTNKVTASIDRLAEIVVVFDSAGAYKDATLLRAMVDMLKEMQGAFEQAGTQSSCYFAKDLLDLLPENEHDTN